MTMMKLFPTLNKRFNQYMKGKEQKNTQFYSKKFSK